MIGRGRETEMLIPNGRRSPQRPTVSRESARDAIVGVWPQFETAAVEFLAQGWDFCAFLVAETWIFRFSKHDGSTRKLQMESNLLPDLGERISLRIPKYEYALSLEPNHRRPFAGYRKLPGSSGDVSKTVDRPMVARQLGLFLSELHAYPIAKARRAAVPQENQGTASWRDRALGQLAALEVDLEMPSAVLQKYLIEELPPSYPGSPRLVHNDLWPEHVLLDPGSGQVSGVIDWADAVIGDPARDFSCLFAWFGEGWLEEVLASYSGDPDSGVMARSRYLTVCHSMHVASLSQELPQEQWIEAARRALRWVFGDGDRVS